MKDQVRRVGRVAAASAIGLAVAHGTVYTIGLFTEPDATWAAYVLGGLVPSAIAAAFGAVALTLSRGEARRAPRVLGGLAWVACVLLTLQAVLLVLAGDPRLFAPDRPGLYSLVGGPAFGWLAWSARRARLHAPVPARDRTDQLRHEGA
jgi:hypothetical protein